MICKNCGDECKGNRCPKCGPMETKPSLEDAQKIVKDLKKESRLNYKGEKIPYKDWE